MAERLTVSLEDGSLDKLRELAGGERKVGAFLSDVAAWLWAYREDIDAVGPQGCVIMRKDKLEDMPRAEVEAMWRATQHLQTEAERNATEVAEVKAQLRTLETEAQQAVAEARQVAQELRDAYAQLKLRELQLEGRLPTQEDSSHNDA